VFLHFPAQGIHVPILDHATASDLDADLSIGLRHVLVQRLAGSIWPLSLEIWLHVSRSPTLRRNALIGGKGVTPTRVSHFLD